eukprot:7000514-Lingulodinium_polyedra.AAC.1
MSLWRIRAQPEIVHAIPGVAYPAELEGPMRQVLGDLARARSRAERGAFFARGQPAKARAFESL